jgi:hypothetical protein
MAAAENTERSNTRIRRHGFVADVLVSHSSTHGDIYHYIILREGSSAIVHGGQEVSMQRAIESIEDFLRMYELRKPA